MLQPVRNPFAYPAGRSWGVDPAHVAAKNIRFSAVATPNGSMVDVLTGQPGTKVGSPTTGIDGVIGPYALTVSNTGFFSFANQTTATDTTQTFAAIVRITQTSADASLLESNSSAAAGGNNQFALITTGAIAYWDTNNEFDSTITPVASGATLLVVVSYSNVSGAITVNFMSSNLTTGQIETSTTTQGGGGSPGAYLGHFIVGGAFSTSFGGVKVAAIMASNAFLSIAQLRAWGANPWGFWYPRDMLGPTMSLPLVGTAAAVASFALPGVSMYMM